MNDIDRTDGKYFLFAINDLTDGKIYFNSRGSAYKNIDDAYKKIEKMKKKLPEHDFSIRRYGLILLL